MKVRADVLLLTETPRQHDWRPSHRFDHRGEVLVVGRVLVGQTPLQPMLPRVLEVEFFADDRLAAELYPGLEWELLEGTKVVGRATLLEPFA